MPSDAAATANGKPVKHIHSRLSRKFPVVLRGAITAFPKGKKQKEAILKHCLPAGMPMMVNDHSTPAMVQESPMAAPPNTNQRIFPIADICALISFSP